MDQLRDEVREQVLTNFEYDSESDPESDLCAPSSPLSSHLASVLLSPEKPPPPGTLRPLPKSERIALALKAYSKGNKSLYATAQLYGVCRNTLRNRIDGKRSFEEYGMNRRLLQPWEEEAILHFIDNYTALGFPPRFEMIEQKAILLLSARNQDTSSLGLHWCMRFLARHPDYQSKFPRHLEQERHWNSNWEVFENWFKLYKGPVIGTASQRAINTI